MEINVRVPFKQLLSLLKHLTPAQKAKLRQELDQELANTKADDSFMQYLLNGPVYSEKDIEAIEENRKSIIAWRTKS